MVLQQYESAMVVLIAVATAVTGVANRVANSNGVLAYGAGNEIT